MLDKFEALKKEIEDKLEDLIDYVIIDEALILDTISLLINENQNHPLTFLNEIKKKIPEKNLGKNHPLVAENLQINSQDKLYDLFVLFRLQVHPLTQELANKYTFKMDDPNVKQFIQQVYFDYLKSNNYAIDFQQIKQTIVADKKPVKAA